MERAAQPPKIDSVLDDEVWTHAPIYSVDIINSRMTCQFDKHFLVRLIAQYDSSARRVLTDLLGSYELVPGTVFHAGYGSCTSAADSMQFRRIRMPR